MAKSGAVFGALADPTRRAILECLRSGGRTAGAVADQFKISWPAVSRHLRVLKAAGLIWETRDGRSRYYEINPQALFPVSAWLHQFSAHTKPSPSPVSLIPGGIGRESTS